VLRVGLDLIVRQRAQVRPFKALLRRKDTSEGHSFVLAGNAPERWAGRHQLPELSVCAVSEQTRAVHAHAVTASDLIVGMLGMNGCTPGNGQHSCKSKCYDGQSRKPQSGDQVY